MKNEYENRREILADYFATFKQLEKDEPELAQQLGFKGYVNLLTQEFYYNEQYELLDQINDKLEVLVKRHK